MGEADRAGPPLVPRGCPPSFPYLSEAQRSCKRLGAWGPLQMGTGKVAPLPHPALPAHRARPACSSLIRSWAGAPARQRPPPTAPAQPRSSGLPPRTHRAGAERTDAGP